MKSIERLESRIAPATLVNPTTVKFIDADGDNVTVHISKPLFTEANFQNALALSPVELFPGGDMGEYLSQFDVKEFGLAAQGLDITITAKRSATHGGNGRVDIGSIDAFDTGDSDSVDLGRVRVHGDLNFIDAGDANLTTPGLRSLDVASIGEQVSGIKSEINGSIGRVNIRGNMLGNWAMKGAIDTTVGSFSIGGSLGSPTLNSDDAGSVTLQGMIGAIKVGHNILGGEALGSGRLLVAGTVGSIDIGGSLVGGAGIGSANVQILGFVNSIHVHGDVIGGSGNSSGLILGFAQQAVAEKVRIDGSLIGGTDTFTGVVSIDRVTSLRVGGDVIGVVGGASGFIGVGEAGSIIVKGSLQGVEVPGDIGGPRNASGSIIASRSVGSVLVGGDLSNASIIAGVNPGDDKVFGAGTGLDADADADSGFVSSIARVIVRGAANSAGTSHYGIEADQIGSVKIGTVSYAHTDPSLDFASGFFVNANSTVLVREI